MAGGEVTGGFVGGLRLIGDPVVDRADALDAQSETAELPRRAQGALTSVQLSHELAA
jgi:hypothetical protein